LQCFGTFSEFFSFDIETSTWTKLPFPDTKGRSGNHMVAIKNSIYMFGGGIWNDIKKYWVETCDDFWKYDILSKIWTKIEVKGFHKVISVPFWVMQDFIMILQESDILCFDTVTETTLKTEKLFKSRGVKRFLGTAVKSEKKGNTN
jgi:hypothetical protein